MSSPLSSCHASALPSSSPAPEQPPPPPPLFLLLLPAQPNRLGEGWGDSGSHPQRAGGWDGFGVHPWPRGLCAVPPPVRMGGRERRGGAQRKLGAAGTRWGPTAQGAPTPHTQECSAELGGWGGTRTQRCCEQGWEMGVGALCSLWGAGTPWGAGNVLWGAGNVPWGASTLWGAGNMPLGAGTPWGAENVPWGASNMLWVESTL